MRYLNFTPSLTYTERWYPSQIRKKWIPTQIVNTDTVPGYLKTDTLYKFTRAADWTFSMPLTTQLYGFYMPLKTNGWFQGLRHMVTPSVSFSYRPNYLKTRYYQTVQINEAGKTQTYSIVQNGLFGSPPRGSMAC